MSSNTIYTPYTYLIGWSQLNKWYYGTRFAKNCHPDDLWVKYFTSSKHVKLFIDEHGDPDIIQIRKIFKNKHQALLWEHKVLRRMNIKQDDIFLNISIGFGDKFSEDTGVLKSKEHKEKIRKSNIGIKKPRSVEYAIKRAEWINSLSENERKQKFGTDMSEENKFHLSKIGSKHNYLFFSPTGEKFYHFSIPLFSKEFNLNSDILYKNINCNAIKPSKFGSLQKIEREPIVGKLKH